MKTPVKVALITVAAAIVLAIVGVAYALSQRPA